MRAGKLFKDMGFTRIRHNTSLIYKCKNRYTECTVYFDLNRALSIRPPPAATSPNISIKKFMYILYMKFIKMSSKNQIIFLTKKRVD